MPQDDGFPLSPDHLLRSFDRATENLSGAFDLAFYYHFSKYLTK
jgi:hypothetical protein